MGNDPAAAAAAALNLPISLARNASLNAVASTWAKQDPNAAFAWAKTLPAGATQDNAVTTVIQTLSEQDPATAANYAVNLSGDQNRDSLLNNITSNWAAKDPSGLLAWAADNLDGANYQTAAVSALNQLAATNPAATAAYLAQNPDPDVANNVIPTVARSWAAQDPEAAFAWAQSLPTDDANSRNAALTQVVSSWTFYNAATAAAYLGQNFTTDPAFSSLAAQVADKWGATNPQAALQWAEGLPQGDGQNSAINAAVVRLAKTDPQTAWQDAQNLTGSNAGTVQIKVLTAWADQNPAVAAAAAQDALNSLTGLTPAQLAALQKIASKTATP